ncbi:MAG: hypothetical protein WCE80_08630, partial [Acidimicrobiia bacterium]
MTSSEDSSLMAASSIPRADRRAQLGWGTALTACALLYRPLTFWADNAWDLASPQRLFLLVLGAVAVTALLLIAVSLVTGRVFTVAILMSWGLFLLFNWRLLDEPAPFLTVAVLALASLAGWLFLADVTAPRVVGIVAVVTVIAPLGQVILAHVREHTGFPVIEAREPGSPVPSGKVEDALLLILDGYPMETVASDWFGHDNRPFLRELQSRGFATPSVSWSHNTFTALAIPSMLEGGQVVDLTSDEVWRNRRPVYEITRGSSLAVEAFRSAGFEYVDVESGWDGDECWLADRCVPGPFADEALWTMLRPSPIWDVMADRWGSQLVLWSSHTVDSLEGLDVFGDGAHDFVYAHLLLPHPPRVVDDRCNVLPESQRGDDPEHIAEQLACVDRMVLDILNVVPPTTAVVISGDHGTATRGQLLEPPGQWDDLDVAERLGAFLAYRLPDGCDPPDRDTNVFAVRALLDCSLDIGE